ncbi:MAG: AURKAIP1/COX24 domain-containing protein [Desulfosarcina sp.]|nr:AURKAIP1/COX24 domain-containing protein [Desulfobacterales bacterium]
MNLIRKLRKHKHRKLLKRARHNRRKKK